MAHWPAAALLLLLAALAATFPVAVEPAVSGPHIADLNVLLPPRMTNPVEYRLKGSGGCFSWSWDHHDILSVQPEYNGSECSTSARLISIAPYKGRRETAVYATDLHTGTIIRCEVFVDIISSIKIFHHSVKLDLDGFATLHIRAFDNDENIFSSLVGLQFLWQLKPISSEADGIQHLLHVPLKETPLSDCGGFCGDLETQIYLEDRGVGSDLYVVKGVGVGHEVVISQLLEPNLEHIVDEIVLTVAEAMSIDPPSPVFVTVGALVKYSLRVIRLNTPKVIDLPSAHHRWSVVNSSVAHVDSMLGIAHALTLGNTDIAVEDTRLAGHVQISSMRVVIPDKLCLYITPVTDAFDPTKGTERFLSSAVWYVFPGQDYIIQMKVLSEGSEIYITENNDLKLEGNLVKYWDIYSVSDDVAVNYNRRNSRLLKPISPGQGILTASLSYYDGSSDIPTVLKAVQEVTVCSKVMFVIEENKDSRIIHLPWARGISQELELKAIGGCARKLEDYDWFSSDKAIVTVSAAGLLRAKAPGQAIVKVVSSFDPVNYDEVVVEVSIPSSMIMLPTFPVEAVVGTQLQVAVSLKTSHGNYYCRCDAFNSIVWWKVISETESFRIVNTTGKIRGSDALAYKEGFKPTYSNACAWENLHASAAGRAVVHAILSSELQPSFYSIDEQFALKAASKIAAYRPLVVYQGEDGNRFGGYYVDMTRILAEIDSSDYKGLDKFFLVPGSGMDVFLIGGPEQWDQKVEYIETVTVFDDHNQVVNDAVLVQHASPSGGRLYRVTCQMLGNFKLVFSHGNLVGEDHPMPVVAKVELPVICSFPSLITLIANEPASTHDIIEGAIKIERGIDKIQTSPVIVANNCTIRIAATGIHWTKRPFANSSSLSLRWELSGCEELAHWKDSDGDSWSTWERFLVLHDASGICTVQATVIGFSESLASHFYKKVSLPFQSSENVLTDGVHLQLVSLLRVIPDSILLVFDPEATVNLSVKGGTCFLDAVTNDTEVVQINQLPEGPECSHLMLNAKGLGGAIVVVRDLGLSPTATASVLVKVANVDWIKIISEDEISLMEGTTKAFDILAGIQDGTVFDSSQYKYMKIHVHFDDGILELVNKNDSSNTGNWIIHGSSFSVRASDLGITTLYVSVRQRYGHEIFSQFIKVEVYQPPRLHPEYIYLIPGASYMLMLKGGPKFGASVEYASLHDEMATVHRLSGKVSAISVGNATVHATVYKNGGTFICEAYAKVEVGIPTAVSLNLQSDQLCIGCKMPIFPSFPQGDLFSFYEICKEYKWVIEDEKIVQSLHANAYEAALSSSTGENISYSLDNNNVGFINIILGRSAGRAKISISFSCDIVSSGILRSVSYSTCATLRVVADPPLALGMSITWILPPFYTTSDLLPASSASYEKDSSKHKGTTIYSVLRTDERGDMSEQDTIAVDGSKIRTKSSNNLACIQAKDQRTGRAEIAACVRIAEVAQIRLSLRDSSLQVVYLAVNAMVELVISYCDILGYPFYEAHSVAPLEVETNYPDIVSILLPKVENNTVAINQNVFLQARSPGRALVRISFTHNPRRAAFFLVSVGSQLFPKNAILHVGQHLNFSVIGDGIDDNAVPGRWVSANESVLILNRLSGEAHARGEGKTQVTFEGPSSKLQTTVTVQKVDGIVVEAPTGTLTNVPFPTEGFKFSIKLRSDHFDNKPEAISDHIEVPYDCSVDPPFIGYSKPWMDQVTGDSYCLFFPYSPTYLLNFVPKSNDMRSAVSTKEGFLYVSVTASLKDAPHVKGSAHTTFVGGFTIPEIGKLNLTPNSNRSRITIIGNTDVEIHWSAKNKLLIRPLKKESSGIVARAEYEVKVLVHEQFKDKLIFVLPTTGQMAEIDVSFELGERTVPTRMNNITWAAILISSIFMLIFTLFFCIKFLDKPERHSVPRSQEPAAYSPAIQERTSNADVPSSPRTPPPFIRYLRETVDETPYYRRQGRRRFDPQYTY